MGTKSSSYGIAAALGIAALFIGVLVIVAVFEAPPPKVEQIGYRGVGMEKVDNPATLAATVAANQAPETSPPPPSGGGPLARDLYQNVEVLGDLEVAEFARLMAAITEWVSPQQGCTYCHVGENFADEGVYTKVVSRRMLQMTRHINRQWSDHVGDTGVTCFTCHRGRNVPQQIGFEEPGPKQAGGFASSRKGQNLAMQSVAFSSLPFDPLTTFLSGDREIRVQASAALPAGDAIGTKAAEHTYGLMMHMTESLGVNCTYCHNSRAFASWEQSPPARVTAWHGIRMVRDLNASFLEPLGPQYPAARIGPTGDAPKAACATCHNGQPLPLNGANMLQHYPSLR